MLKKVAATYRELCPASTFRTLRLVVLFRTDGDRQNFMGLEAEMTLSDYLWHTSTIRLSLPALIGLLSGRLELGTGFNRLTDEIRHDMTRLFPVLPNGKAFRPADFLLSKKHPEVYVYDVDHSWAQVILSNNDEPSRWVPKSRTISAPVAGNQADVGSLGLSADKDYHVFDFWAQQPLGVIQGDGHLSAELETGEARVYSVREVKDRPQIIGTNRHIMCGMMEVLDVQWEAASDVLNFDLSVIGGEPMVVTLALPKKGPFIPEAITAEEASASFERNDDYMRVVVETSENQRVRVALAFSRGTQTDD